MVAIKDAVTDFSQWHASISRRIAPPLRCQFPCKSSVQYGGFVRFMGIEDGLNLFLGGIELGKQRLKARNKALLFI